MNEWIRHSDAKAAVTLAFTGVIGAMTFNLVNGFDRRSIPFDMLVLLASALLLLTAALCGLTLTPRMRDKDASPEAVNLLYFNSISQHYKGRRTQYAEALEGLTADRSALIRNLAEQIHANARIATFKAKSAKWAIRSVLLASAAVAAVAVFVGVSNS